MHVGLVWLVKLGPEFLVLDSFRYTLEHDMHFVCSVCVCVVFVRLSPSLVMGSCQVFITYSYVIYKPIL